MKKKLLAVGATFAVAVTACVGFAACGENAENYVSQEVDKTTFLAAFSEESFTNSVFEGTIVVDAGEGDEHGKTTAKMKFVVDGVKEYMKGTTKYEGAAATSAGKSEVTLEAYYDVGATQSDTTIYYKDEKGAWATTSAGMSYGYFMYQPTEFLSDYLFDEEDYELFAFNEEKKGYYYEEKDDSVLLKFKDGKLYSMRIVEKVSGGTMETSLTFIYGGQSVTLPTV